MKTKLLLLFFFSCFAMSSQITDLQKLSKGTLSASEVIRDSNNNIKGYFFLFETDKIAKETVELEYVVLDENLTKVTNGFISEMKFESLLINAKKINVKVSLYKNKLLLEFTDVGGRGDEGYKRYKILDLQNNELSNSFIFTNDTIKLNPKFDRKMSNYMANNSQSMTYYNDVGLVVDSRAIDKKTKMDKRYLAYYDANFKEVWRNVYENSDKKKKIREITYLNSDEDVVVLFNHTLKNNYKYLNDFSIILINAKNGELLNEFSFPKMEEYAYKVVNCVIKDDEVNVLGNFSNKSEFGNTNDTENKGLFSFRFNRFNGKLLGSRFLNWEDIGTKLNIDKNGFVKNEGYIFIHNMLTLKDNKIIVVCEMFKQSPITTNNICFLELSKNFTVTQVFGVDKFKNKFPGTAAHSNEIKKHGLFDFIDYQNLGDEEFLFFFNDNEKNSKNRKKSTLYGIVSYSDGKFKRQTLDLKTETSTIKAYPAKKGYLMLIENFDAKEKSTELRLEKINY